MSAGTEEWHRRGGGGLLWILALLGLGLFWLSSLGAAMEGYTVSPHAEERHGSSAARAAAYLDQGGAFKRDPCKDGKEMWTWRQDGSQWLAIVRGDTIITLFETNQEYIEHVKERDGCGNGLQLGTHDLPSMAR